MGRWRSFEVAVAALILVGLVATGAVGGAGSGLARHPAVIDDGTATATVASLPTDRLRIDQGRFGTDVAYLRVPDAALRVTDVTGTPRLFYRVRVPALDVERTTTRLLSSADRGRIRLEGVDRAIPPGRVSEGRYTANVAIAVQSFEGDWTVRSGNESVPVRGGIAR